jgi:hypothetical protein
MSGQESGSQPGSPSYDPDAPSYSPSLPYLPVRLPAPVFHASAPAPQGEECPICMDQQCTHKYRCCNQNICRECYFRSTICPYCRGGWVCDLIEFLPALQPIADIPAPQPIVSSPAPQPIVSSPAPEPNDLSPPLSPFGNFIATIQEHAQRLVAMNADRIRQLEQLVLQDTDAIIELRAENTRLTQVNGLLELRDLHHRQETSELRHNLQELEERLQETERRLQTLQEERRVQQRRAAPQEGRRVRQRRQRDDQ